MTTKAQWASMGIFGVGLGVAAWALGKFLDKSITLEEKSKLDKPKNLEERKKDLGKPKNPLTSDEINDTEKEDKPAPKINTPAKVGDAVENQE